MIIKMKIYWRRKCYYYWDELEQKYFINVVAVWFGKAEWRKDRQ